MCDKEKKFGNSANFVNALWGRVGFGFVEKKNTEEAAVSLDGNLTVCD